MSSLQLDDRQLPVDKDGYLIELADWSEAAAAALAEREGKIGRASCRGTV